MESSYTFRISDITNWWHQQEEIQLKYAYLSIVAHNIVSIRPHGVGVEPSYSLGQDVIGKRQSKTTGKTHRENLIERQHARATHRILATDDTAFDSMGTENDSEIQQEVEESKLH